LADARPLQRWLVRAEHFHAEIPMAIRKARKNLLRRRTPGPMDYVLHVTIDDISPPIWRDIVIGERTTLVQLHRTLQVVFGWFDMHLHMFKINGVKYAQPEDESGAGLDELNARSTLDVTIKDLQLQEGATFTYEYDFGDSWTHTIEVASVHAEIDSELTVYPLLIGGERAAPPEDCGGLPGYEQLLKVLRDPKHKEHESMLEWLGLPFDPELFDMRTVTHALTMACGWGAI
jgi:Plasmid pRiA4b ORF-3-like protein